MTQDLDSHDHIAPVAPSWAALCGYHRVDPANAPLHVHALWEQECDQYQYEMACFTAAQAQPVYALAA